MRILVSGGKGQLGRSLAERAPASGHTVVAPDIDELDICDDVQIRDHLAKHQPEVVINAAAYTATDKAESERERAFAVNGTGAGLVARACASSRIPLLHVSTDYVFDGLARRPYREDDPTHPLSAYGASKAAGEVAVHAMGGTVVRSSWVFSAQGPSFVQTVLRLAKERRIVRIVGDQQGCPTYVDDLADALLVLAGLAEREPTYHFCSDGVTTWHGFAQAIVEAARRRTSLACEQVDPIPTTEYPTPARRPPYSVLDTTKVRALGIVTPPWTAGLATVIARTLPEA